MEGKVIFCVSCRIALGKLRRVTNIAQALRGGGNISLVLLANSGTKGVLQSLKPEEFALFDHIEDAQPAEMASRLKLLHGNVVVVDTMRVPDLHQIDTRLCLVLREAIAEELPKFHLKEGRLWDLLILPHPAGHWTPDLSVISARRAESVGWIYRRPELQSRQSLEGGPLKVLITTGGGSGEDRGNDIRADIEYLIQALRPMLPVPVEFIEVMGPRDWKHHSVESVDQILKPGPELHNLFSKVDLVISAAGYNTVLELACTDVPVLLVPVPRYTDDQEKRARLWGNQLGMRYLPAQKDLCVRWMADVLQKRLRRPAVDIGPSGAEGAATLIRELLPG